MHLVYNFIEMLSKCFLFNPLQTCGKRVFNGNSSFGYGCVTVNCLVSEKMRNEIVSLENSVYCSAFSVLNVKGMLHDDELIAERANCEL